MTHNETVRIEFLIPRSMLDDDLAEPETTELILNLARRAVEQAIREYRQRND
jgi:hypothetical protein